MTGVNATSKPIRGDCPTCAASRQCDVVAQHVVDLDHEDGVWTKTEYRILQCRGCEAVFFQSDFMCSECIEDRENPVGEIEPYFPREIRQWPAKSTRKPPEWADELSLIDPDLKRLFTDIYTALDNDLGVLAAIGIRTVFDRASELLAVDPAKTFGEKLSDLLTGGKIGSNEKDILTMLADAGSAAAHRGWRPSTSELAIMAGIVENFLYRAFVIPAEARKLENSIPPKPARKS